MRRNAGEERGDLATRLGFARDHEIFLLGSEVGFLLLGKAFADPV